MGTINMQGKLFKIKLLGTSHIKPICQCLLPGKHRGNLEILEMNYDSFEACSQGPFLAHQVKKLPQLWPVMPLTFTYFVVRSLWKYNYKRQDILSSPILTEIVCPITSSFNSQFFFSFWTTADIEPTVVRGNSHSKYWTHHGMLNWKVVLSLLSGVRHFVDWVSDYQSEFEIWVWS